jgi:hypothetical protein
MTEAGSAKDLLILQYVDGTLKKLDAQIEADVAAGKLGALAAEALAEYHSGQTREL